MFCIGVRTCRTFTLAEILLLAAVNVETIRPLSRSCIRPNNALGQRR